MTMTAAITTTTIIIIIITTIIIIIIIYGCKGCGCGNFEADGSVKNTSIVFHQKSNRLQHRNITNGPFQDNFANLNNIA